MTLFAAVTDSMRGQATTIIIGGRFSEGQAPPEYPLTSTVWRSSVASLKINACFTSSTVLDLRPTEGILT